MSAWLPTCEVNNVDHLSLSSAIRCPCRYYFKRTVRQEWHLTNQHLCGVLQQKSNPPLLRRASSIFGERNPAEVNLRLMRTNMLADQQSLWNNLLRPAKFQAPRRLHTAGPCSPLNTSEKAAKTSHFNSPHGRPTLVNSMDTGIPEFKPYPPVEFRSIWVWPDFT